MPRIQEQSTLTKAFETRRLCPGNRRMATLAGVYSVGRHVRTAEDVVAALFREERPAFSATARKYAKNSRGVDC